MDSYRHGNAEQGTIGRRCRKLAHADQPLQRPPALAGQRPRTLDEAVGEAYGWGSDWRAGLLTDDEIIARLFRLNQQRAAQPPPP